MNLEIVKSYTGRPATTMAALDDPQVQDYICARLIGGTALRTICQDLQISSETMWGKMAACDSFRSRIDRARDLQQDAEIERTVDLADDATNEDWKVKQLQIEARWKRAGALRPSKYGTKQAASVNVQINIPSGMAEAMQLATSLPVIDAELDKS